MATASRSWVLRLLLAALVVAVVALDHQVEATWGISDKSSVRIRNELPGTLQVQCKSADDDLGAHSLAPGLEQFWNFYLNWQGTTDFWCRFAYGPRWQVFDVWTPPGLWRTEGVPCWKCRWVARIAGFYRAEEGKKLIIVQPWRQDHYPPLAETTN